MMDETTIKAWASRLGLARDKVADIVKVFGAHAEGIFQHILSERKAKTTTAQRSKSNTVEHGDFGIVYKGRVTSASTAQKQAAVIKALARRFRVSEADFKAAVLRYGSIAKALEARRDKAWGYDTVERSLFPTAQKGRHPLSPAAMFGRYQDAPDTVESQFGKKRG